MVDHTEYVQLAQELIAGDGRSVTFYKLSATPADTNKPWDGPSAPTTLSPVTVPIINVPVHSLVQLGINIKPDDLFYQADVVIIVAPPTSGELLEQYHVFDDSGVRYKITRIEVLKPGPVPILYAMGASR